MSQIMRGVSLCLFVGVLALTGCGEYRESIEINSASGTHPQGWDIAHPAAARAELDGCRSCHGERLDGGISGRSCSVCHLGSGTSIHPDAWGDYTYARHKGYVAANGTVRCATALCHGTSLAGSGSAPSCATACHLGGVTNAHPAGWTDRSSHKAYVNANGSAGCKNAVCHGTDGKGVFLSGPACDSCHEMK